MRKTGSRCGHTKDTHTYPCLVWPSQVDGGLMEGNPEDTQPRTCKHSHTHTCKHSSIHVHACLFWPLGRCGDWWDHIEERTHEYMPYTHTHTLGVTLRWMGSWWSRPGDTYSHNKCIAYMHSHAYTHAWCDPQVDGELVESPRPLPWYPNNYAWKMNFSRGQLRKVRCACVCQEGCNGGQVSRFNHYS